MHGNQLIVDHTSSLNECPTVHTFTREHQSICSPFGKIDLKCVCIKLMRLGSPNWINVVKSKSKSKFDRRLSSIWISRFNSRWRSRFRLKIDLFSIKIDRYRYKFDLLIDLNWSNVDYSIENRWIWSKMVKCDRKLSILVVIFYFLIKFDQFQWNSTIFDINLNLKSKSDIDFEI